MGVTAGLSPLGGGQWLKVEGVAAAQGRRSSVKPVAPAAGGVGLVKLKEEPAGGGRK